MKLDLNDEDIKMIKEAFSYCRCLYRDHKIENWREYCDGECNDCEKQYKIDNWLKDRGNKQIEL